MPAAIDLTTVSAVRTFLQKQGTETQQDGIIGDLITRASREILRETEREFKPKTDATARKFVYQSNSTGFLDLAPYDLRAVTQVRVDTDGAAPATLTADQYRLYPRTPSEGVYTYLRLYAPGCGPSVFGEREVEITGNWGFASVPEDVEHWCIVTVSIWLRRDVQAFERTFSIEEDRLERPLNLPASVRAGLADWKRVMVR